jgi:putative membrane protein
MMWNGYGGMGFGGAGMMLLSSLSLLFLLFGAGYLLYRAVQRDGGQESKPADQTLAQRYARGEIDEQEYRHRLGVLRER